MVNVRELAAENPVPNEKGPESALGPEFYPTS